MTNKPNPSPPNPEGYAAINSLQTDVSVDLVVHSYEIHEEPAKAKASIMLDLTLAYNSYEEGKSNLVKLVSMLTDSQITISKSRKIK